MLVAHVIPRVFHQIWLGPEPLPAEFEPFQESWRRHHPGWELKLWGEDNLPADLRRAEVYDTERQPVERADILRLELVWRFGGVYLDTDYECLRPIDGLLEGVDFFTGLMKRAGASKPARVNNAIFGAVPGHPLLDRALDELRVHEPGARYDKHLSGAMFFNALVMDNPDVTIFPPEVFYPATDQEREQAFGIHHAARLWHDAQGLRKIMLRAETRLAKTNQRLEREQRLRERDRRLYELAVQRLEEEKRALEERLAGRTEQPGPSLKILFFLRSIHFDRVFEPFLRALLERGHALHVVLSIEKRGLPETKTRLFDEFRERYHFTYEQLPRRSEPWLQTAVALRHALDYLRYLEPEFAHADPLRERARERAPLLIRMLFRVPLLRGPTGRRAIGALLRRLEAAIPVPRAIRELIEARRPDVVLVAPLVGMGSTESEFIRAAEELGVPTVLPVASWDNLTNKGVLRDVPTTTIVWNEAQVEEAVRLHHLPREQVVAVGAHSFDHWFGRSPSTTREEFAGTRSLDPERPLLLYLGSSYFISGDETAFIREWLARVRAHPALAEAAVILRPHPQNGVGWEGLEDEPGRTAVWPRTPTAPTDDEKRADYFDTLAYADAAVGINTTALIEAAMLHRPVFSLISEHFTTQEGTLHFAYVADGPVTVARSWDEHLEQLARAVEAPGVDGERFDEFVRSFIRPGGLDVPAAPAAADAVERTAATTVPRRRRAPVLGRLLVVLTPLAMLSSSIAETRRVRRKRGKTEKTTAAHKQEDRVRAATEVWREREQRLEEKHQAKAAERAERARQREQKEQARGEKARQRELAAPSAAATAVSEREQKRDEKKHARAAKQRARKEAKATKPPKQPKPPKPVSAAAPAESQRERRRAEKEEARAAKLRTSEEAQAAKAAEDGAAVGEQVATGGTPAAAAPRGETKQLRSDEKQERARKKGMAKAGRRAVKRRKTIGRNTRRSWKSFKRGARGAYNVRNRFTYRSTIARVPSRNELPVLLNARGLVGRAAEIGVRDGRFSDHLLEAWKGDVLISIDPWLSADPDTYVDRANVSQEEFEHLYLETQARLARHGSRSEIWRKTSLEAAALIPDGSLDFAYIDARHDYASVLEDLEAWLPKVKPGGILAGHDYADIDFGRTEFGVKSAVDEFFEARSVPVHCTDGPSAVELLPSWIVEIPADGAYAQNGGGRTGVAATKNA
jgi:methyltransferase family protein/glycosyl transferase-like sugar-binding protein